MRNNDGVSVDLALAIFSLAFSLFALGYNMAHKPAPCLSDAHYTTSTFGDHGVRTCP